MAVLTEVAVDHGATALAQALSEHSYVAHTPAVASNNARDYQVMLECRGGRMEVPLRPRAGHLPHRCTAARIRRDDLEVVVVGLYMPSRGSKERRNVDKRAFQTAVTALLPDLNDLASDDVPVLVVGDLNVVKPGHVPAHANFGDWGYAFYRSLTANSFTDGFRRLHPDDVDHSWFGRRSGAGYRFDHLFTRFNTTRLVYAFDCDGVQIDLSALTEEDFAVACRMLDQIEAGMTREERIAHTWVKHLLRTTGRLDDYATWKLVVYARYCPEFNWVPITETPKDPEGEKPITLPDLVADLSQAGTSPGDATLGQAAPTASRRAVVHSHAKRSGRWSGVPTGCAAQRDSSRSDRALGCRRST